ncbi:MAG: hypothetical protein BWK80_42800 [Desulfobacteraceae bacterium IS3]|nr:MAG: hypothetical protein BWK80_42800 [Desulfobacteraceae bacterium IS3]
MLFLRGCFKNSSRTFFVPEGLPKIARPKAENRYCRERRFTPINFLSPAGTAEPILGRPFPADKSAGYFQMSLRDLKIGFVVPQPGNRPLSKLGFAPWILLDKN